MRTDPGPARGSTVLEHQASPAVGDIVASGNSRVRTSHRVRNAGSEGCSRKACSWSRSKNGSETTCARIRGRAARDSGECTARGCRHPEPSRRSATREELLQFRVADFALVACMIKQGRQHNLVGTRNGQGRVVKDDRETSTLHRSEDLDRGDIHVMCTWRGRGCFVTEIFV